MASDNPAAPDHSATAATTAAAAAGDISTGARAAFDAAVDDYLHQVYDEDPAEASFLGLTEYDHQAKELTAAAFARRERALLGWLDRFESFDLAPLSHDQQVDLNLLKASLGSRVATRDFEGWRRSIAPYLGNGVFELFAHGNRPEEEAVAAAIDRIGAIGDSVAATKANIDPELADPTMCREWGVRNAAAQASFLRQGLGSFVADDKLRARLETAGAGAAVHYDDLAQWVGELADRATGSFVFGEARYDAVLRIGEGFDFGAQDVRRMGHEEIARLDAEMSTLANRIGGSTDWHAVMAKVSETKRPQSMDDMLRIYRDETHRAQEFVRAQGILKLPAGESCKVEPSPLFYRAAIPVASYYPPAFFGPPTAGQFNVPFTLDTATDEEQVDRLRSNSFLEIPAITAHEAYPGHHGHFAILATAGLSPIRAVLGSTYMIEGWGLYAEQMMGEFGFYETDVGRLGQMGTRIFRAGRMVVDTSLHLGEMTPEEAVTFMVERVGLPEATARGEVLRYCMRPTQASAYLTGAMEIERMAARWVEGGRGTLPDFHLALLSSGMLPLGVAAQAIGLS
ncbi:MAG TPA: DUF885 domain-containing protein [Acidimicrobiales bacterium]